MGKGLHYICVFFVVCMFMSCSPQTRFNHLVKKYPYLLQVDTTRTIDTLFIKGSQVDTFFYGYRDTFYINHSKVSTRIIKNIDTLYFNQKVDPDTIYTEKLVIEKMTQPAGKSLKWWHLLFLAAGWIIILVTVVMVFVKTLTK